MTPLTVEPRRLTCLLALVLCAAPFAPTFGEGIADPPPLNLTHSTSFVAFPQDCNANPPMVFGGKLLAEMDRCAGVTTRRLLYASTVHDAVTVAINDVRFLKPGQVKDLIVVSGEVVDLGAKSITVRVTVERENRGGTRDLLAEGKFVFVAYDVEKKKAVEHGLSLRGGKP